MDAFEDAFSGVPAFIDGHQHVHVFPLIRDLLIAEVVGRYGRNCWIRSTVEPFPAILRRGVAAFKAEVLGARQARLADRAGLARNDSFRGGCGLSPASAYDRLFPRFLDGAGETSRRLLIFCHPGHVDALLQARSTTADARASEYAYFASSRFCDDCAAAGYRIAAFGEERGQTSGGGN